MAGKNFRRCHPNLGSGVIVHPGFGNAANGRAHDIHQPKQESPLARRLAQGRNCICRLTGLADGQDRRSGAIVGVAIAQLTGNFDIHHEIGQLFKHIAPVKTGIIARTARNHQEALRLFQAIDHGIQAAEVGHAFTVYKTPAQGIAGCLRLLKNLLEHKMGIVVEFSCVSFPFDALGIAFDLLIGECVNSKALARDLHHIVVFQVDNFIRQL